MKECGRATRGVSQAEVLTRQIVIPSSSKPGRDKSAIEVATGLLHLLLSRLNF